MFDRVTPTGQVLDIACGTGLVARRAAQSSEVGKVEAIDVAPPMIDKACALDPGDPDKISYSVASALDLPFADEIFDVAYCQQGLQFFPDQPRALREAHRVLKPGGTAVFSTWTFARDGNPVFAAFEDIVAAELGSDLVPFGPFSFGDRNDIESLALDAGFTVHSLDSETRQTPLPDIRTFVLFDLSFLGRPASDGTLQPILDFGDPANDSVIEKMINKMSQATEQFRQEDESLLAPMTAHVLVVEAS